MAKCSSCGAPIVFLKTPAGAAMPCDPPVIPASEAHERARQTGRDVRVVADDGTVLVYKATNERLSEGARGGRTPHWSTCPNARQHRKGG